MGKFVELKCKFCKYEIQIGFGIGMAFPRVYEQTITAAKNGELGEEIQNFLSENPNGAIDVSRVLAVCKTCGACEKVYDLTMYLPKENILQAEKNNPGRWSVAMPFYNSKYVMPSDLKENYKVFAAYPHKCKRCGGEVEILNEDDVQKLRKIKCPKCHSIRKMKAEFGHWD